MDKIEDSIRQKIIAFASELEKTVKIKELYLFGSYAKGNSDEFSDIDLAVVSDDFTGVRHIDYDKFIDAILKSDKSIEPIAFRSENFTDADFFVKEIRKNSIKFL